ncbi:alanine racemase [Caldalkalibacillus thermarum]|uniref:alanine racemase n=1 Tax=Caldalkalibacillus thermarum TaxID=296745 RepID=UPI001664488C|nr:alanine racemase [Caldalkalibacillus thermarum]GGK21779.1 alanine racemase [Caldalkalibacillus thermarum]
MQIHNRPKPWDIKQFLPLSTPRVMVHYATLCRNIAEMSDFARRHNLALRPHFKTHKTLEIVQMQLKHGAAGVTVASLSEAEALISAWETDPSTGTHPLGKLDLLIAFPIVGDDQFTRAARLNEQARLTLMVDHMEAARSLHAFARRNGITFRVMVKINTGLNRCGLDPDHKEVVSFVERLLELTHLQFIGLLTHAGHAYGAENEAERERIARQEGEIMAQLGEAVKARFPSLPVEISVGATPTVRISGTVSGVTEIRPGNYVFNDRTQVRLGSATWSQCALRVLSRVVSHPAPGRWVIDAGAKTLALDQGAHGKSGLTGYGYIVGYPELAITRLSEEHGVVEGTPGTRLTIGQFIQIIPNHACPVVNLTDRLFVYGRDQAVTEQAAADGVLSSDDVHSVWHVIGRGKTY